MLHREHFARAAEAGLDLIGNQHDAVPITQRAQCLQEFRRGNVETTLPLHGLHDDRRHPCRLDVLGEYAVHPGQCVRHAHPVIRDGKGRVEDFRRERSETRLVGRDLAGESHRQQRTAVEGAAETDDPGAAGVHAGNLHRILHRFGAGRDEQRLLRRLARRERVQFLGEGNGRLVRRHHEAGVAEAVELLADRGLHARVQMASVQHGDARPEVDVAAAFDVPELRIRGPVHVDGELARHAPGHGQLPALLQLFVAAHGALHQIRAGCRRLPGHCTAAGPSSTPPGSHGGWRADPRPCPPTWRSRPVGSPR